MNKEPQKYQEWVTDYLEEGLGAAGARAIERKTFDSKKEIGSSNSQKFVKQEFINM